MNWVNTPKNAKIGTPHPATPGPSPRHRRRRRSVVSHARTEAGRLLFGFRSIDLYSQNGRGSDRDTFPLTRPSVLGNPLRIMTFRKGQPPISGTRKKSLRGKGGRPELRVNIRPPTPFRQARNPIPSKYFFMDENQTDPRPDVSCRSCLSRSVVVDDGAGGGAVADGGTVGSG